MARHMQSVTQDGNTVTTYMIDDRVVTEAEFNQDGLNELAVKDAITDALAQLDTLIAAPALTAVPSGTLTTAQLSNALRTLRNEAQQTRAGAQDIARTLKRTIRLVRSNFAGTD